MGDGGLWQPQQLVLLPVSGSPDLGHHQLGRPSKHNEDPGGNQWESGHLNRGPPLSNHSTNCVHGRRRFANPFLWSAQALHGFDRPERRTSKVRVDHPALINPANQVPPLLPVGVQSPIVLTGAHDGHCRTDPRSDYNGSIVEGAFVAHRFCSCQSCFRPDESMRGRPGTPPSGVEYPVFAKTCLRTLR